VAEAGENRIGIRAVAHFSAGTATFDLRHVLSPRFMIWAAWQKPGRPATVILGSHTIFASNGGSRSGASNSNTHKSGSNFTWRATYASAADGSTGAAPVPRIQATSPSAPRTCDS